MKIEDERLVPFNILGIGDTFDYDGAVHIKIGNDTAFNATDDMIVPFNDTFVLVNKIDAVLLLEA